MSVIEGGLPAVAIATTDCPMCHAQPSARSDAPVDRRDDVLPWALVLTAAVVVASVGAGAERWFGLGTIAGLAAGSACAWVSVRAALQRRRAAHAREVAALTADADGRVAMVVRQFEWAVNDVAKLRRDNERAEAAADALVERSRQRERYVEKLERQLFEARERLAMLAQTATTSERPEFDPLADALAGIVPFNWSMHKDRAQVNLELECGVTSRRPTRVRIVDAVGEVLMTSGTPMWNDEGRACFSLADPPGDLLADLDAGRTPRYTIEALSDYEWHPVRLEDSGRRTRLVTDKQGRIYRVSDDADAAQLLAPTLH